MKPSPRTLLAAYLWALVCFLVLDAVWLSVMGPRLYQPALGSLMAPQVDWAAAALFYALYLVGLVPGDRAGTGSRRARRGAAARCAARS
ncbi:MAG: DUF2177 family protein, partial [Variovorax sp.]|nr:DUF2177 family protein [Variovorax sp.]